MISNIQVAFMISNIQVAFDPGTTADQARRAVEVLSNKYQCDVDGVCNDDRVRAVYQMQNAWIGQAVTCIDFGYYATNKPLFG